MEKNMTVPKFASEADEAKWWFEHQDLMLEDFQSAAAEGTLGRGTAMRRALEAEAVIQLDAEDARKAHAAAARKGISYQSYVKALIHEALEKEIAA